MGSLVCPCAPADPHRLSDSGILSLSFDQSKPEPSRGENFSSFDCEPPNGAELAGGNGGTDLQGDGMAALSEDQLNFRGYEVSGRRLSGDSEGDLCSNLRNWGKN